MARKHFDEYYNKICKQFFSLNDVLEELSEEVGNNMVEPERLKQLQKTIQPIKDSYMTLNYIKYLLDKPTKKSKHVKYDKEKVKVLKETDSKHSDQVLAKNEEIIKSLNA